MVFKPADINERFAVMKRNQNYAFDKTRDRERYIQLFGDIIAALQETKAPDLAKMLYSLEDTLIREYAWYKPDLAYAAGYALSQEQPGLNHEELRSHISAFFLHARKGKENWIVAQQEYFDALCNGLGEHCQLVSDFVSECRKLYDSTGLISDFFSWGYAHGSSRKKEA